MTETNPDPRVARSKAAVLDATIQLLCQEGYAGTTVDGVAARSGVAKTTIYRHWESRAALILDAFDAVVQQPEAPDTGSLAGDLVEHLSRFATAIDDSEWGRIVPSLVEGAERDHELAALAREFSRQRRTPLRVLLERGLERGEVRDDLDLDMVTEMVAGPIFYRRFLARERLTPAFVATLVDGIVRVLTPGGEVNPPARRRSTARR